MKLSILTLLILLCSLSLQAKDTLPTRLLNQCSTLSQAFRTGWLSNKPSEYFIQAQKLKHEITGLNHLGVVAWEPKEANALMRKLIRYHGLDHLGKTPPVYAEGQKLGRASVKIDDLHFSQVNCKNGSDGGYTVINNAKAFRDGTLKPSDLPPLQVWRDETGKIWSLDHRRLAAMRLSGAIDKVEVEFVAKPVVDADRFKFATETDGKTLFVEVDAKAGQPPMAIVIGPKPQKIIATSGSTATRLELVNPHVLKKIDDIVNHKDVMVTAKWKEARGPQYLSKLNQYALDLEKAYQELEASSVASFRQSYDKFGSVSGRSKTADSILTKLIRKDLAAFENDQTGINSLKKATDAIGDGIGARVTFKASPTGVVDPKTISHFVDQVIKNIDDGAEITEIMNYRGKVNGLPYLSDAQVELIRKASERQRLRLMRLKEAGHDVTVPAPLIVKNGDGASYADGYSAFHLNIRYKSGITAEVQVRGPLMDEAAEIKHLFYDLLAGKPLAKKYTQNPKVLASAESFKALSPADKELMGQYIEQQLTHARRYEMGQTSGLAPPLPPGLPENLSFDYLRPHLTK